MASSNNWGTPPHIIELVKDALGGHIDLDPASSVRSNRIVGARRILTARDNALKADWPASRTVYCNPPGGKIRNNKSRAKVFWERFATFVDADSSRAGVFAVFNIGTLPVLMNADPYPLYSERHHCQICIASGRVRWLDNTGRKRIAPPHGSAFIFRGPDDRQFQEAFSMIGPVLRQ